MARILLGIIVLLALIFAVRGVRLLRAAARRHGQEQAEAESRREDSAPNDRR